MAACAACAATSSYQLSERVAQKISGSRSSRPFLSLPTDVIFSAFSFLTCDEFRMFQTLSRRAYQLLDYGSEKRILTKLGKVFEEFLFFKLVHVTPKISLPILFFPYASQNASLQERTHVTKLSNSTGLFILQNGEVVATNKTNPKIEVWKEPFAKAGINTLIAVNEKWLIVGSVLQNIHGPKWYDEKYLGVDLTNREIIPVNRQRTDRSDKVLQCWLFDNFFFYEKIDQAFRTLCCRYLPTLSNFIVWKVRRFPCNFTFQKVEYIDREVRIMVANEKRNTYHAVILRLDLNNSSIGKKRIRTPMHSPGGSCCSPLNKPLSLPFPGPEINLP